VIAQHAPVVFRFGRAASHRHSQGGLRGHGPHTFLEHTLILCLETRHPKQNSVIRLKSNTFRKKKIWAGYASATSSAVFLLQNVRGFIVQVPRNLSPFFSLCFANEITCFKVLTFRAAPKFAEFAGRSFLSIGTSSSRIKVLWSVANFTVAKFHAHTEPHSSGIVAWFARILSLRWYESNILLLAS